MPGTYRLARAARRDLQEISDYWTFKAGEDVASRVVAGVIETVIVISHHPQAGVAAAQFGDRVRKFPAGKYMIYYRPYTKGIAILHVFHGARHQAKSWPKSRK
jgi:toxin ParE1/3/4